MSVTVVIKGTTIVRFSENSLKLQNGFGDWRRVRYHCDIDTNKGNIVDVKAE